MFSNKKILTSTQKFCHLTDKLKKALDECDAVIIGAGAGLSTAAGYTYGGERFEKYFSDYEKKYGFSDMYSGGFYPYRTEEEFWAYWSEYIYINRYADGANPLYSDLLDLVRDKDYFVLTTNVDHCFQKAGFDKKRLFYTQGDYGLFQCSVPCCDKTFDNEEIITKMVQNRRDFKIPSELVPRCPNCGAPLTTNLRCDDKFVQDDGWYAANQRYNDFLRRHKNTKVLFLELGVGANTPVIIKYPFWRMAALNENAVYCCVNYGEAQCPVDIAKRSICINADIADVVGALKQA